MAFVCHLQATGVARARWAAAARAAVVRNFGAACLRYSWLVSRRGGLRDCEISRRDSSDRMGWARQARGSGCWSAQWCWPGRNAKMDHFVSFALALSLCSRGLAPPPRARAPRVARARRRTAVHRWRARRAHEIFLSPSLEVFRRTRRFMTYVWRPTTCTCACACTCTCNM